MYVYQITNLINNKLYIGITNNYKKRWSNHKCCNNSNRVITRAIRKYGVENFKFELLFSNLSIEDSEIKEKELIQTKNTQVPNGYNIQPGGFHNNGVSKYGYDNNHALLTKEEAEYIKTHRNLPCYILYEEFNEKISYGAFLNVYHNRTYCNVEPTVDIYPYNAAFSNQFTSNLLEYDEVVELREQFNKGIYWKEAYKKYKNFYTNIYSFWNVYFGKAYPLVMPEVFTKENKYKQSSFSNRGINNGRAKLKEEDVIDIRDMFSKGFNREEILKKYPNCKRPALNYILSGKTWQYLL